jgi:chemotaxis methyl-accepting protein methylase
MSISSFLRRMLLHRQDTHQSYLDYLCDKPDEIYDLYDDLLIGVTSFFRAPEAFELLQRDHFWRRQILVACAEVRHTATAHRPTVAIA